MMSSEASTEEGLVAPKRDSVTGLVSPKRDSAEADALQPWQLFTLAGLIGATVVVFFSRGQTPAAVILLSCAIFAAAYVGASALRTVLPLTGNLREEIAEAIGDRTRAALEREKMLVLRSIKELEFDRGMGKVSNKDFDEMSARLRARAARLMRQLDAGSLYREQIEKEIAKRLEKTPAKDVGRATPPHGAGAAGTPGSGVPGEPDRVRPTIATSACPACAAVNDADAKFCKNCGARLEAAS